MKNLNLEKLWEICNRLSYEQLKLEGEKDIYVSLLGNSSNYCQQEFESFLSYYSFKVEDDNIVIFNEDGVPYELYTNQDFSYIPICLLSFSAEKIEKYIDEEIEKQLKQQELNRIQEKEDIKRQIELLKKKLEN
jgi:hypothetical protein